jgi:hypothetical protein
MQWRTTGSAAMPSPRETAWNHTSGEPSRGHVADNRRPAQPLRPTRHVLQPSQPLPQEHPRRRRAARCPVQHQASAHRRGQSHGTEPRSLAGVEATVMPEGRRLASPLPTVSPPPSMEEKGGSFIHHVAGEWTEMRGRGN